MERIQIEGCESPVGLCFVAEYSGSIKGHSSTTVSTLLPTGDSPTTGVLAFTADSVIDAKARRAGGQLFIKNAGAFQSTGNGNIVDIQVITGGTGDLAGASGTIRASGIFDPATGAGESRYEGELCLSEA